MSGGYVAGHKIIGDKEYEAAIQEARIIEKLRKETDMSDPVSVKKLYDSLQAGEIRLDTVVGRSFDDEIYELICDMRKYPEKYSSDNKNSKNIKKNTRNSNKKRKSDNNRKSTPIKNNDKIDIDAAANEILRKANKRRKIIIGIASAIAVGSMAYFFVYSKSAYTAQQAYDELAALKGSEPITKDIEQKPLFTLAEAEEIPDILDDYKNIYIKNKSIIGWISIEDTNIDYPVMQTVNNDYYLKHDFEGKDDNNGALFLDCNCNAMFRSDNLIIYGHHMKSGKMFGGLKKYQSEDYCKKHNIIKFDTIYEKGTYEVMYVFTADITNAEDVSFKYYQFIDASSKTEFDSNMSTMAEMSLYDTGVTAEYGDDILTLSTCDGSAATTRFVVVAKRIK